MSKEYAAPLGSPVAGYLRVSRVGARKGEGFISPEEQREGIARRAADLGLTIPDDAWFFDADRSGGNFERPEWEQLMGRIEGGDLGGVIVVRVDRFARNVAEGATMIKRIERAGGLFAAVDVPMDTRTPEGQYLLNAFLNNAELQLNLLKAGWKRSKKRAIARGAHIGRTPLGYARVPRGAEQGSGTLLPRDDWREPIRLLFEYAAEHSDATTSTLASWANGAHPRPDGKRWTPTSVGHVLANRVYLGEVAYRPRPGGEHFEPLVTRGAHEALVDEATFAAAQRVSRPPRQSARGSRARRFSLLQGLVRCAGCRHTLVPSKAGANVDVYRCDGDYSSGRCPAPASISAHIIEPWLTAQVRAHFELAESFTAADATGEASERLDAAETALAEARRLLDGAESNFEALANHPESWARAVEAAKRNVAEAEAAYADAAHAARGPVLLGAELTWDTITPHELRDELLPALIDCVMVRAGRGLPVHEKAVILWRGQADGDLPGKGRPAPSIRSFPWPHGNQPVLRVAGSQKT
jgi:DNA invertase Pin-like site-specific DNA recombinase